MSLIDFLHESNRIEGKAEVTQIEFDAAKAFLAKDRITVLDLNILQGNIVSNKPIRSQKGMDVTIGASVPPLGGPDIVTALKSLLNAINADFDPWMQHVAFELLHPYMDGNGRTGRLLWAWSMRKVGRDPFAMPFLEAFYRASLAFFDRGAL